MDFSLADEDSEGYTAMHLAVKHQQMKVIELLLEQEKHDVKDLCSSKLGFTPLHLAVQCGFGDIAYLLVT